MDLSDLVRLKNTLIQYSNFSTVRGEAEMIARTLSSISAGEQHQENIHAIAKFVNIEIANLDAAITDKAQKIIEEINGAIHSIVIKDFNFKRGYSDRIFSLKDSRNYTLPIPKEIGEKLFGRIRLHADWHFPGMEIGTHDGEFTSHLVGCDPLYIVDAFPENLVDTKERFTPEYRPRVRPYCLGYAPDDSRMDTLPINQFGLIFSWNTFNYMSFIEIQRYLVDIFSLLRSGGVFIFSFNDASTYRGAQQVEWGRMSYMPKNILFKLVKEIGFELTMHFGTETNEFDVSFVEIKKPGELFTIKAHPTLGEIRNIE